MQKWEYKIIARTRKFHKVKDEDYLIAGKWESREGDNEVGQIIDIFAHLNELGKQGWELVSVVAESEYLGGFRETIITRAGISLDYAGFTDSEKLYLKRPLE
jgi:hypothetical protein